MTSRVRNFMRVGVPVSVVAPDVLFDEADVQERRGEDRSLPLIPPPMKAAKPGKN